MNYLYKIFRSAALMFLMMAWIMPSKAQHPFTLTTQEQHEAHSGEALYWIESKGATGFYMIPTGDNDDAGVSTSNMPNEMMLWYFMDAGVESTKQYYYIINKSTGKYLRLKGDNGADGSIGIKTYASDDSYKFSISGSEGQWLFSPKSGSTYYVNKKGSNVNYTNGLKSSTANDDNSKWKFVAKNSVTWAHPFTNSTSGDKHFYLIQNRHKDYTSFYMSIDDSNYVIVSDDEDDNRAWYFVEASSDAAIPNMKYYYIVNDVTGKYMYFNSNSVSGASLSDVFKIQDYPEGDEDKYQFAIVNAVGTSYSAYAIMPKNLISLYQDKYTSLGSSTMENNEHIGTLKDRGLDYNAAHWVFVSYVAVKAPTITNNDGTITLSTATPGATIYYTTNGDTPDNTSTEYSSPFSLGDATVIKAIAYLGSDCSTVSTYNVPSGHDYSQDYLTFRILTTGTICWKAFGSGYTKTIEYSINNGSWTSITSTSAGETFEVNANDVVRFRGNNTSYAGSKSDYSGFEGGTATFNIEGNIHSLLYGDSFTNNNSLTNSTYQFCSIFKKARVISAENLILPATSLTNCCYRAMFSKCTTLVVAPALPATTLADYCYYYMFEECAITSAPALPATTLVSNCYGNMFTGCTYLNYILCLAENKSASGCLTNWVNNVAASGTFVKDPTTSWSPGSSGIPSGWVVNNHHVAPEDPVITCDGDFILITCDTHGADIYYRLGQTGDYSPYSTPIAINENTVVEAYAEKYELQSNKVIENCIKIKKFAGMKIAPGPLYYGRNGFEIKDDWSYNSYNSVYGKTVGSTYFNFIELGQLFESSVFSTSDGDIEKVLDPHDGWRVPTNAEWASIIGTTRSGSTVNGSSNKHYAMIQLTTGVAGLLIFPDGGTIIGAALSNMDNTTSNTGITTSQLDNYLSQGCVFLPGSGSYDGSTWNNEHHYWSATENNSSTGYDLYFEPSNTISSDDNKNKESYYSPVYLVKGAADEATRLLRTWTYNSNEVELPYSVNAIDGHSGNYARSTFNFTTDVRVNESQPTYLWFQHADQSADIYVNNTKVETHWGGYNAFFTDITDAITPGINHIRVTLNNTSRNTLAPYAGDFNFNATLGEVKLISSPVVPSPDYGYDGFHITSTVTEEEATITVKTTAPTGASLTCSIKGEKCDYSSTRTSTGEEITFETTITDPHLWNGTLDPYLYNVTLTIAKDGVVYHKFQRGYGFRFFEYVVDGETPANSRFLLNGSPYLLRGVCMHHDLEGKANALTAADIDNDFELLKDLGCNFVRLAHYPHPKEVYDHCDKMGIIVQTEAPWVNKAESTLPNDYYTHLEGQFRDMVNQHYNHPCIIFWGLSNETTTDDKVFAKEKINGYITLIKGLDSSRLVGYVMSHSVSDPSGYYNDPDADWFGCNIYSGWYIDQNSNDPTGRLNTRLNNTLTRLSKPLAFSEYGCGGTQSCHSDDFMSTTTRGNKPRHDIEYQMWLHEGHIAAIKNFPQLLFTSQWQLFDIAVKNRQEGYKVCFDGGTEDEGAVFDNNELKYLNNKGLVERDHKTKKDPFYLYKAWWNQTDKFVHICGKDYKKLNSRVIKCYTNDGNSLTLYVNNKEIQTVAVVDNIATFTARDFNPGDVVRVDGATKNDTFTFTAYNKDYVFMSEGYWNEAAKWSGNAVPDEDSDVTIIADVTIPSEYTANADDIGLLYGSTLTIADGGQLVSNSAVNATVEKNISAYSVIHNQGVELTDDWYFIASPVSEDYTPTGSMLENTYDLYRLNNNTWQNFKNTAEHPDFTTLNNGAGYLYANSEDVTLQFSGTLKPYAVSESMSISAGWNLIGNPFAYNVFVNREYYKMNPEGTGVVLVENYDEEENVIPVGMGIVVKATEESETVTFSKEAPVLSGDNSNLKLTLTHNIASRDNASESSTLDKAIVRFNVGTQLQKFYFGQPAATLFIPQNGEDYAIVLSDHHCDVPVYFKANELGTYTISFAGEEIDLNGIYLIDIIEQREIDLSTNPSYTFIGSPTDRYERFKIVFRNTDDNGTFAFINNGNIIITADTEGATLQVIDMMGRVIVSRKGDISGKVSTSEMTPGAYVLRLISGDKIMTQKIVIR
ncbi:MAG: chitobiase/beta-hexosaminidase C-terminal domain-containing protein [Bacteroidales bacterium]|nr:chitobiase/beta-hexosaminidase C-terminal domain-containing protein [Bacteroidales bacterium]